MTRPMSPRATRRDWDALGKLMEHIDSQQSTDELVPAWRRAEIPEPRWAPEYLAALQSSLEGRRHGDLLALLDQGYLIHPILLPALADVLRGAISGWMSGAPRDLVQGQEAALRRLFHSMVGPHKMKAGVFYEYWAERLSVSVDTIKRTVGTKKR